jgi:hypothetical protein
MMTQTMLMTSMLVLVTGSWGYPHLRLEDKQLSNHLSPSPSLVRGSFVVSTPLPDDHVMVHSYCINHPDKCSFDPLVVSYRLNHCLPDPLGTASAVKVVADHQGNVTLTTYNDTSCTTVVETTLIDMRQSTSATDVKYDIHTSDTLSSTVHFVKKYYFDESCTGPHSKVALGSYVEYNVRAGTCWNDPFNGHSYTVSYLRKDYTGEASEEAGKQAIGTADVELCAFDVKGCGGCDLGLIWNCSAAYTCYTSAEPAEAPMASMPGYNQCIKEGSHYVFSLFGGNTYM